MKEKGWSRAFPYCISCKTTDHLHYARGLCTICYSHARYEANKKRQWELNKQWRTRNPERHKELQAKANRKLYEKKKAMAE